MDDLALSTSPICPRCGYDQSGAIATGVSHEQACCPLDGVCSECGLEFAWVDVMRPWRHRVPGLFEHACGARESVSWAVRTWWMALWPLRFWRRVPLAASIVLWRLWAWPLIIVVLAWSLGALVMTGAAAVKLTQGALPPPHWAAFVNAWTNPLAHAWVPLRGRALQFEISVRNWGVHFAAPLAMTAAWPLLMLILSDTMRAARLRRGHILRAATYSFAWIGVLALVNLADAIWEWLATMVAPSAPSGIMRVARTSLPSSYLSRWWPLGVMLCAAWLCWWWHTALSTGFRLPAANRIWGLLVMPTVLLGVIVLCLTGGMVVLISRYALS